MNPISVPDKSPTLYDCKEEQLRDLIRKEADLIFYGEEEQKSLFYQNFINAEELYCVIRDSEGKIPKKESAKRKTGEPYFNHILRIIIRNQQRGLRNQTHYLVNCLHDVFEICAKLGENPYELMKTFQDEFIPNGMFSEDEFHTSLLLTRPFKRKNNGTYVEIKGDEDYMKYICVPPNKRIKIHGFEFNPSKLSILTRFGKRDDTEDNIDQVLRGNYFGHNPGPTSRANKYIDGHMILYALENATRRPKIGPIPDFHPSYILANYPGDYLDNSINALREDLESLIAPIREDNINSPELMEIYAKDCVKRWLDEAA